ncbi:MAG: S8/S53 family peptidase [Anaerolineaceae bacterium]|nr:S8/S53 family peptidase [Anaerolineaceae bacterium]
MARMPRESLLGKGIIPVLASGNEYKNDSLPESACTSNSFAVGALSDQESPILAPFSNHNDLINITAPGDNINSSINPRSYKYDGEVKWTY